MHMVMTRVEIDEVSDIEDSDYSNGFEVQTVQMNERVKEIKIE